MKIGDLKKAEPEVYSVKLFDKNKQEIKDGCKIFNHTNDLTYIPSKEQINKLRKQYSEREEKTFNYLEIIS